MGVSYIDNMPYICNNYDMGALRQFRGAIVKQGRVVEVRVSPKDCMSAIDIVQRLGVYTQGMSFASVVRIAMSSAFQLLRENGTVPDRDGFEFSQMMQPFAGQHAQRVALGQRLAQQIQEREALDAPGVPALRGRALPANDPQRARLQLELSELVSRKQADPLNFDAQERLDELFDLLHGAP